MSAHDDEFPFISVWTDPCAASMATACATALTNEGTLDVRAITDADLEPVNTCESEEAETVRYLEMLRKNEGACVTILCDNPEAEDRDHQTAIEVVDDWTDWKPVRFSGESILQCLAKAALASSVAAPRSMKEQGVAARKWNVLDAEACWHTVSGTRLTREDNWVIVWDGADWVAVFNRPHSIIQERGA